MTSEISAPEALLQSPCICLPCLIAHLSDRRWGEGSSEEVDENCAAGYQGSHQDHRGNPESLRLARAATESRTDDATGSRHGPDEVVLPGIAVLPYLALCASGFVCEQEVCEPQIVIRDSVLAGELHS